MSLNKEQFSGYLPTRSLRPTEDTWVNERGSAAKAYQQDLVDHIQDHGMPSPIEVEYAQKSKRSKPALLIAQGHHRWHAAKTLKMDRVPVTVKSYHGKPPGLEEV